MVLIAGHIYDFEKFINKFDNKLELIEEVRTDSWSGESYTKDRIDLDGIEDNWVFGYRLGDIDNDINNKTTDKYYYILDKINWLNWMNLLNILRTIY